MNLRETLLALAIGAAFIAPAHAGGLTTLEDPEVIAPARDRANLVPFLILGAVVAAIVLGGSDGDCNGPTPEPKPQPGGC